jgi:hypothetical protein
MLTLVVVGLVWGCRVETSPAAPYPEVTAPAQPPAPACPPCQCPVAQCPEVTPEVAPAAASAEPLPVPAHLVPTEVQCATACGKLMEAEAQRVLKRLSEAESALVADIRAGLKEEAASLKAECVKRCLAGFSSVTTACIARFSDPDRVRECLANTGLAFTPPQPGGPAGPPGPKAAPAVTPAGEGPKVPEHPAPSTR